MAIAVLLTATLRNLHYSELKGAPGSGKQHKKKVCFLQKKLQQNLPGHTQMDPDSHSIMQ